ncbi:MAG: hypothetical protein AB7I30_22970, partial [Isosphaeraceae bacterium]
HLVHQFAVELLEVDGESAEFSRIVDRLWHDRALPGFANRRPLEPDASGASGSRSFFRVEEM